MFADTPDAELLQMFWAIHAIQDGREANARKLLACPENAVTSDLLSKYVAHKWSLETLLNLVLNTSKGFVADKRIKTNQFDTVATLVNMLGKVEEEESKGRINADNILLEMHRIGHRQFQWQRGWKRPVDLYRYLFIYGDGECAEFFQNRYGLSMIDFVSIAFALFALLGQHPWTSKITGLGIIGVDDKLVDLALSLLCAEIRDARAASQDLLLKVEAGMEMTLPIMYQPSYLRLKPIIRSLAVGNNYIAPFPEFILMRVTVGLYYDLIPGGQKVMNHANYRFEEYARRSIKAYCPDFTPEPAVRYKVGKNTVDSPDVLLWRDDEIVVVFECKATKLTFEAQYGDDPVENARNGYAQIAKAIFQLWKFFSHVRRGLVDLPVSQHAVATVLTMEPWTQMGGQLRARLIADAEKLAAEKDSEITAEDMRPPIFCSIQDLDEVLATSNEDQFLAAFRAATDEKYRSWGVREVRRREVAPLDVYKDIPFHLEEMLPWWGTWHKTGDSSTVAV